MGLPPPFTGELFHPLDDFCETSMDVLQKVHISPELRTLYSDAVLQVRSHQQSRGAGSPSCPAGHTSFNEIHGWFSGLQGHLAGLCPVVIHQYLQGFSDRAVLHPACIDSGVCHNPGADITLRYIEPHGVNM